MGFGMNKPCLDCETPWDQLGHPHGTYQPPGPPVSHNWKPYYSGALYDIAQGSFLKVAKLEIMVFPLRVDLPGILESFQRFVHLPRGAVDIQQKRNDVVKKLVKFFNNMLTQLEEGSVPFRELKHQISHLLSVTAVVQPHRVVSLVAPLVNSIASTVTGADSERHTEPCNWVLTRTTAKKSWEESGM